MTEKWEIPNRIQEMFHICITCDVEIPKLSGLLVKQKWKFFETYKTKFPMKLKQKKRFETVDLSHLFGFQIMEILDG